MTADYDESAAGHKPGRDDAAQNPGGDLTEALRTLRSMMDLISPMALRVAATLGLADLLPDDEDGMPAQELAERAGADDQALARMLRHLVRHADIYLLSGVIHNWDDERAAHILRRCAEAAGNGGRVLVIEAHISTQTEVMVAEMDLRMLVLMGGCYARTIDDFTALAGRSGLRVAGVHPTTGFRTIIECVAA